MAEAGKAGEETEEERPAPRALCLLHDSAWDPALLEGVDPEFQLDCMPWEARESIAEGASVLLYLGDEQVSGFTHPFLAEPMWVAAARQGRRPPRRRWPRAGRRSVLHHYGWAPTRPR